jgi:hypothetical protein
MAAALSENMRAAEIETLAKDLSRRAGEQHIALPLDDPRFKQRIAARLCAMKLDERSPCNRPQLVDALMQRVAEKKRLDAQAALGDPLYEARERARLAELSGHLASLNSLVQAHNRRKTGLARLGFRSAARLPKRG